MAIHKRDLGVEVDPKQGLFQRMARDIARRIEDYRRAQKNADTQLKVAQTPNKIVGVPTGDIEPLLHLEITDEEDSEEET